METRLRQLVSSIRPLNQRAQARARARQDRLTKPRGSLGRLEELSIQLAGITGHDQPVIVDKAIITMAGDHGVARDGVSAYPQEVTAQMVLNFLHGGAAINVMARHVGARVVVVDMGVAADLEPDPGLVRRKVAHGTASITRGPAMTQAQALEALLAGAEIAAAEVEKGLDILGTGDMGIGNTTPSAAIAVALTGRPAAEVVGRGTGVDDAALARKITAVDQAIAINQPNPDDALEVLAKVGGFEIAGLAGAILGAAAAGKPVVIDGFISGAAAMIAVGRAPEARPNHIATHRAPERGQAVMLEWLGLKPLLDLDLRLGEGTGAALGIFLAEAACRILSEMATFDEAGVSERGAG